jgi:HlyD family secretion protein
MQKEEKGPEEAEQPSAKPSRASRLPENRPPRNVLVKPLIVFGALICAGTLLILTGARFDADTLAQRQKYGILTAEEVNVAFEKVSAKLIERPFLEGSTVKKGDVLMALDPTDTDISIRSTKAQIAQNAAEVENGWKQIDIDLEAAATDEKNRWRNAEALQAALNSAVSSERRTAADYRRAQTLVKTGAVSQASYDSARNAWESAVASAENARKALAAATVGATKAEMQKLARTGSAEGMHLSAVSDSRASIENRRLEVKALEAQGDQLRASLDSLLVQKSRLTLAAPEDGKIVRLLYQKGEIVPSDTAAVLLQSRRQYYEIYVNEKDAARFAEGTRVVGETPDGRKVEGTVRVLSRAPSFADIRGSRERGQADLASLIARIYITPQKGLVPGTTIEVKIHG